MARPSVVVTESRELLCRYRRVALELQRCDTPGGVSRGDVTVSGRRFRSGDSDSRGAFHRLISSRQALTGGSRVLERITEGVIITVICSLIVLYALPSSNSALQVNTPETYSFSPEQSGQLVLTRQWAMVRSAHPVMQTRLRIMNGGSSPSNQAVDEVIAKPLASRVVQVKFW